MFKQLMKQILSQLVFEVCRILDYEFVLSLANSLSSFFQEISIKFYEVVFGIFNY